MASSPAIGSDGTIYFGSADGYLYALTPEGSLKWRYQTGMSVSSSPAIGSDGTVYFGSKDGYLYAIESSSKGLADSPWPKFRHDNQNTGRAEGGPGTAERPLTPPNLSVSASFASGRMRVTFALPKGQSGMLRVYNVSGQRVSSRTVTSSGEKEFSQALPDGVYLVRLESAQGAVTAKAVLR